ncbi:tetratricopeptide repeat protein [Neptunomonas marina]|uniref:Sel1 repeat family protein n=1 Tax=Neptunomonas marina TaxID=1815562 RepID=A0A437Q6I7_9GAMM|nr:tetratricopeptide repeat protein [Neptunomonas marina]RVU30097.1 sel1 repeat family protein [Neptunomonas marina]
MSKKLILATASLVLSLQAMPVSAASVVAAQAAFESQDYAAVLKEVTPLAKEGNPDATNLLGQLYEGGLGVNQDIEKAKSLYNQGARQGHIGSVNSLRKLKNKAYKVELEALMPKVEAGDASAQNRAGEMYEFGYGTPRDGAAAFNLYKAAADQGLVSAQHNLGRSYNFGTGTEQSFEEAEHWYRVAARQGHTDAMFYLGTLYSNGYGQDSSHDSDIIAYAWMHNAAALGNGTAASIESRLLMKLEANQMAEAKSLAEEYKDVYVKPFK